jgi:hypothetical protein
MKFNRQHWAKLSLSSSPLDWVHRAELRNEPPRFAAGHCEKVANCIQSGEPYWKSAVLMFVSGLNARFAERNFLQNIKWLP